MTGGRKIIFFAQSEGVKNAKNVKSADMQKMHVDRNGLHLMMHARAFSIALQSYSCLLFSFSNDQRSTVWRACHFSPSHVMAETISISLQIIAAKKLILQKFLHEVCPLTLYRYLVYIHQRKGKREFPPPSFDIAGRSSVGSKIMYPLVYSPARWKD